MWFHSGQPGCVLQSTKEAGAGGAGAQAVRVVERTLCRQASSARGMRAIPEETAIAFSYNRAAHAVMMATPIDLEDFAMGFSLAERIIDAPGDVTSLEVVTVEQGIELRMTVSEQCAAALDDRRRHVAGPSGCGLCGLETLEQAMRTPPVVHGSLIVSASVITSAMAALPDMQAINQRTHAVHAAAFYDPQAGLLALREDVGRHNALDKLAGALARSGTLAAQGLVLLTSRVSIEMVQKAALMGATIVVAVSAPTALAVRTAEAAGITLIAVAREDSFEIFTHAKRVVVEES
jgi:FdhD protein